MNGKILKIKTGFNPNSSSIGVDVVAFFTAGAAMTVLFNVVASLLGAAAAGRESRSDGGADPTPALASAPEEP